MLLDKKPDHYSLVRKLAPDFKRISSYLLEKHLIITITDKNLRCAICSTDWIKNQTLQMLSSLEDYKLCSPLVANHVLAKK